MPSFKSKSRFDGLDVCAMVSYLRRELLGRRIINIYDGISGNDLFLFKLESLQSGQSKVIFLIESGIRCHITEHGKSYQQEGTTTMPSPFCSKLRKHLRGLRLEKISQLGNYDRVIHFIFGSGTSRHSMLLELYARGNLILTDSSYTILALLRSHEFNNINNNNGNSSSKDNEKDGETIKVQVGHVYPLTHATTTTTNTTATTTTNEEDGTDNKKDDVSLLCNSTTNEECMEWVKKELAPSVKSSSDSNKTSKKKGSYVIPLKALLLRPSSGFSHYGPSLIEHCLLATNVAKKNNNSRENDENENDENENDNNEIIYVNVKLSFEKPGTNLDWMLLLETFKTEGQKVMKRLETDDDIKGYVLYRIKQQEENEKKSTDDNKKNESTKEEEEEPNDDDKTNQYKNKILVDFQPHLLLQHTTTTPQQNLHVMEYKTFSNAIDSYFAHLSNQRHLLRMEQAERVAKQRLDKIKMDQERRVDELQQQIHEMQKSAQLVEHHSIQVDAAIKVINSALDNGMNWESLHTLIQVEQSQNRNPIALLISELKLEENSIIMELKDDDDFPHKIQISLDDTAHGNARNMFTKYRTFKEKTQKTLDNAKKALKAAEIAAQKHLADAQQKNKATTTTSTIDAQRKPHWFEKFHWFITSDNYLVLGGRDAHQNELLVKRYLRPGDAYLHADVHGAASCILRAKRRRNPKTNNKTEAIPLPTLALREAGNFTICRSSAWSGRQITSAWWVEAHQVSKTAPTGEYLTVGSFMVRGRKNFLPPTPLEMGLGVLFRLGDDESIARHGNKERRDFALLAQEEEEEENAANDDKVMNRRTSASLQRSKEKELRLVDEMVVTDSDAADSAGEQQQPASKQTPKEENGKENDGDKPIDEIKAITESDTTRQEEETRTVESANGADGNEDEVSTDVTASTDKPKSPTTDEHQQAASPPPAPDDNNTTSASTITTNTSKKKKKGLSVKERKLIRKYGSLEAAQKAAEEREQRERERGTASEESSLVTMSTITTNSTIGGGGSVATSSLSHKRGKKGKMKRAAKKYADQDDEDRELALLALHGGEDKGTPRRKNGKPTIKEISKSEQKAAAETAALLIRDPKEVADKLSEDIRGVLEECLTVYGNDDNVDEEVEPVVRWDKMDADVLEQVFTLDSQEQQLAAVKRLLFLKQSTRVDNFSSSLSGIIRTIKKYGHENLQTEASSDALDGGKRKTKAERQAEQEAWKETLAEEGIADEDGDAATGTALDDTAELNKLTGKPLPEDSILYAVPVCAPYQTLAQYKYRVKLTPGNQKRGKAAKQCLELLLEQDKSSQQQARNRDLIKHVGDNEWVQVICADVKISAAGAAKVKGGKGKGGARGGGKKGKRR